MIFVTFSNILLEVKCVHEHFVWRIKKIWFVKPQVILIAEYVYGNKSDIVKALEFGLGTLYGTEHPWFWRIQITALVSLGEYKIIYLKTNHNLHRN